MSIEPGRMGRLYRGMVPPVLDRLSLDESKGMRHYLYMEDPWDSEADL